MNYEPKLLDYFCNIYLLINQVHDEYRWISAPESNVIHSFPLSALFLLHHLGEHTVFSFALQRA